MVSNHYSCGIPPFHMATHTIPKARGSLGGYGRYSLADVHLEVLGASDFGVKSELRLGDALDVRILDLCCYGLLGRDVETVRFGLGAYNGGSCREG